MTDEKTTIKELKQKVETFIQDRDWQQFHDPKNMSMNIVREATELMEHFTWCTNDESWDELEKKRQAVQDEVADIAFALLNFCSRGKIDLAKALEHKIEKNAQKYPIAVAKGRREKYDQYQEMREKDKEYKS